MAMADVAVEMGPRNRRRLAKGAVGVAVITAVVAGMVSTRSPNRSGIGGSGNQSSSSPALHGQSIGAQDLGIPFGASAKQVLQRLGPPTRKQGSCWIYGAPDHAINGLSTGPYVDAKKYCFSEGATGALVVTSVQDHTLATTFQGRRYPAGWTGMVSVEPSR